MSPRTPSRTPVPARGRRFPSASRVRGGVGLIAVAALIVLSGCGARGGTEPASTPPGPVGVEAGLSDDVAAPAATSEPPGPGVAEGGGTGARSAPPAEAPEDPDDSEETPEPAADPAPERLLVPGLGLDEPLIELGLLDDGTLEAPARPDDVGWFAGGSRPGQPGPTVIAAHVDGPDGPAVFYDLPTMVPGDQIEVAVEGGERVRYVVRDVADHPKDDFPTAAVFGATPRDELRLVTCTGPWDPAEESYTDNRVVYAEAVED